MNRRWRCLAVALVAASCRQAPPPAPATDLRELLPEAELWRETSAIDFGSRPEPALLGGWSLPSRGDADFLWGFGERSDLELRRADARPFRIRLRGWAHPRLPEGQEVRASLNGVALAGARFGDAPATVEFAVAEGVARPGLNRLELAYPVVVPTGRYGRPYGPALDGVRFDAAEGEDSAAVSEEGWRLPSGTGIDFFPELRGVGGLHLEKLEQEKGAALAIDLACAGAPPVFGLEVRRSWSGAASVDLGTWIGEPGACRLTLRASPGPGGAGSVRFARASLLTSAAPEPAQASPSAATPPSFVIYLVDALRADRLGAYGQERRLTPEIDRFAAAATLFENARAQSSWTRPAVATLFTGLTPLKHGAVDRDNRLPDEIETVGERLRARGYRTAYVTSNGNTAAAFGFDQGIDAFHWLHGDSAEEKVPWPKVNAAALGFLDSVPAGEPFLLVVHTVEPHAPYRPTKIHRDRWAAGADPALGERPVLVTLPGKPPTAEEIRDVTELYEAEVANADEGFGAFLTEIERRGRRAATSVLFLSDHGEELFDHQNVEHGRNLYEEQLRIPAIWSLPGDPGGRRVSGTLDQLDVLPTILELAGAPADPALPGRSFAAALRGGQAPPSRPSAAWLHRLHYREESVFAGGFKLRRDLNPQFRASIAAEELYDLGRDPGEKSAIEPGGELEIRILRARLRGWEARSGPPLSPEAAAIDERLREELRALGYIQ